MTVPTTTSRADYTGNGVTTAWTVPFYFLDPTHIQVVRTQISTGVATTLALTTDYTVAGAGVQAGGTVTTVAALTTDQRLSILRSVPFTQLSHYVPNDPFPSATHEQIVDQLTMEVQQLNETLGRALTLSANSSGVSAALPGPTPNNLIGWNSAANALVDIPVASLATAIVANTWVVDKFNGTGARTAFTLTTAPGNTYAVVCSVGGVVQVPGVNFSITGAVATFLTGAPPSGAGNVVFQYGQTVTTTAVDAGGVTYTPSGTGAVAATAQTKLRERVSVKDFGAQGDGATDDTAAIQACINANQTATIYFPPGTYKCSSAILLTDTAGHNFQGQLIGDAGAVVTFTHSSLSTAADSAMAHGFQSLPITLTVGSDVQGMRNALIQGLTINAPTNGAGIYLANCQRVSLVNNTINGGRYSVVTECCIHTFFERNTFSAYVNGGIGMLMSSDTARVYYGSLGGVTPNDAPASTYWNDSPLIMANAFASSTVGGLAHILDMGSAAEGIRNIQGNYFFNNSNTYNQYGILSRGGQITLISNWFENINFPVRILSSNVSEGGSTTTLTGVTGAQPSGTYQIGTIVDGYAYAGTFTGNFTARAINDYNLSGITGGPCFIGQNLYTGTTGAVITSSQSGNQMIVDAGNGGILNGGQYKNLTYNQYTALWGQWAAYTPVVTPTAGSITSYTVNSARFIQRSHAVEIIIDVTITNNGTGSGGPLNISTPVGYSPVSNGGVLVGRETVTSGLGLIAVCGISNIAVFTTTNTYPVATNSRVLISGTYQTA